MSKLTNDPARGAKWLLLITSIVTAGFLVAAALHENVTAEWRRIQSRYRSVLASKAKDDGARAAAARFSVEVRQVTVPALKVVDRCVTCHVGIEDPRMADQKQPYRTHPRNLLQAHRLEKFGCTVCHQGQGAALNFAEAKAENYFWDYPLLPRSLTEASCATCHDPARLPKGTAVRLVRGRQLFHDKGCSGCHKLEGKGGALGLALDNVGMKTKHQFMRAHLAGSQTTWNWHDQHFRDPGGIVPGSLMVNPTLTLAEREALTVYMLSLRRKDVPEEYLAKDKIEEKYEALHPAAAPDGQKLYQRYCSACHDTGGYTSWARNLKRFVPAIRNAAFVRSEDDERIAATIRDGRPGTFMPGWGAKAGGLDDREIEALVAFLRQSAAAAVLPPAPRGGSPQNGRILYARNCAGCHGVNGKGGIAPALANPSFQAAATDEFIVETIRQGRVNTPMPSFGRAGVNQNELADLLAWVRELGGPVKQQHARR